MSNFIEHQEIHIYDYFKQENKRKFNNLKEEINYYFDKIYEKNNYRAEEILSDLLNFLESNNGDVVLISTKKLRTLELNFNDKNIKQTKRKYITKRTEETRKKYLIIKKLREEDNKTFQEIAKIMELSKGRVNQIYLRGCNSI